MTCTTSSVISNTTHQTTREVRQVHQINKPVEVEHVNIQKHIVNTHVIHQEQLNYVYNVQNRTIYQPVNNLGTIINITA